MPSLISHIHLFCNDLEKTLAFWTRGFGAKVVEYRKFGPHDGVVVDIGEPLHLYIKAIPCEAFSEQPVIAGFNHVGMTVDNLQETIDRLVALPDTRLYKPVKKRETDSIAFVIGPDNVIVELRALNL
ncbi:MAG: VOC family protein [Desulfovibrio sp.]|jgi:catechol 2,3-dioxygenase-like lactoylglutathione lyase family enzyme|nr:VOC family protein [Desulfovibrio sp.]